MNRARVELVLAAFCLSSGAGCSGGRVIVPRDTTAPTLTSVSIADAAVDVPRDAVFTATFSEELAMSSVTLASVSLSATQGGAVAYTAAFDVPTHTLTITPTALLANYADHVLELTTGLADTSGNALVAGRVVHFRTVDDVPPEPPAAPAWDAVFANVSGVLSWSATTDSGTGLAGYQVEVRDGSDNLVLSTTAPDTSLTVDLSGVDDGTELTARVAGVDQVDLTGAWSDASAVLTVDHTPPTATGVPSSDAAYSTSLDVGFTWSPASDVTSGIDHYEVEISTSPTGTPLVDSAGSLVDPQYVYGGSDGETVYARARAVNRVALAGDWSDWSSAVLVDVASPAAPGAPSAATVAGSWSGPSVGLSWTAADDGTAGSGVAAYTLEVTVGGGTPTTIELGNVLTTTLDASDGDVLVVRVRATDAAGNVGAWSDPSSAVDVDGLAPTTPGTPVDAGEGQVATLVHFAWTAATDAGSGVVAYDVEVHDAAGCADLVAGSQVATTSTDYSGSLGQTLYARVRAVDAVGHAGDFSACSDGIALRTDVPDAPGKPSAGARYSSLTLVTFTWTAPAAGPAPDHYVLEVGTSAGASDTERVDVSGTSHGFTGADGVTYYGRVAGATTTPVVKGAFSPSSDPITVDTTAPSAPGLVTIAATGGVSGHAVHVSWVAATDATSGVASYEVELDGGSGPIAPVATPAGTSADFDLTGYSGPATAVVRATDGAGNTGPWSTASASVTIDGIAPQVLWARSTPQDGATVPTNADLELQFSEAMDTASVEAAFSLTWGASEHPAHGYGFTWSAGHDHLTVQPDTKDPAGVTNADVLPEATTVALAVAGSATDVAGNGLTATGIAFAVRDETPPSITAVAVGTDDARAGVVHGLTASGLTFTFSEGTDPTRGHVSLRARAFTIDGRVGGSSQALTPVWTGPRTLHVGIVPQATFFPGEEVQVTVDDVWDLAFNYFWGNERVQVAGDPAVDTTPPSVVSASPASGATLGRYHIMAIALSEPVVAAMVSDVQVAGDLGRPDLLITYDSGDMGPLLLVRPVRALPAGASFSITIPATLADLAGNLLGSPFTLGYTVGSTSAAATPWLLASQPADLAPTDETWRIELTYVDTGTTDLAALDAATVGIEDFSVTNTDTGLLVRGVKPRCDAGRPFVVLELTPGTSLHYGSSSAQVTAASADGTAHVASYTLGAAPVGLLVGSLVSVTMADPGDGAFGLYRATVTGVAGNAFEVAWPGPDLVAASTGSASWDVARDYHVDLAVGAGAGGTGFQDVFGNAVGGPTTDLVVRVTPPPLDRVPGLDGVESVRLAGTASPVASALQVEARVRDPDGGSVTVDVYDVPSGTPRSLTGTQQVLGVGLGPVDYRYEPSGGGPPAVTAPAELATYVTGLHPFWLRLDDGAGGVTTVPRRTFLWAPADTPRPVSVTDGTTTYPVSSTRPVVLVEGHAPVLAWNNVDTTHADVLFAYVIDSVAAGDNPTHAFTRIAPLDVSATQFTALLPATPALYAWTPVQMKLAPGGDTQGTGWGIDFSAVMKSAIVYGPSNDQLDGSALAVASAGVQLTAAGRLGSPWDSSGTVATEPAPASGTAVFATYTVEDQLAGAHTGTSLYGYVASTGALMITQGDAFDPAVPFPKPLYGFVGRAGQLFATVQGGNTYDPSIMVGAQRIVDSFPATLTGNFVFVHVDVSAGTGGIGLGGMSASIGTAVPTDSSGTPVIQVDGVNDDGSVLGPMLLPYAVSTDGILTLQTGPTSADELSGAIGGTGSARLIPVARTSTDPTYHPDGTMAWLLIADAYPWTGAETVASLVGDVKVVHFEVEATDDGTDIGSSMTGWGVGHFDGAGGLTYTLQTQWGPMSGVGTYSVDATAKEVVVNGDHFVAGPDLDTLLGIKIGSTRKTVAVTLISK